MSLSTVSFFTIDKKELGFHFRGGGNKNYENRTQFTVGLIKYKGNFDIFRKKPSLFGSSEYGFGVSSTNKLLPLPIAQFPDRLSLWSCVITGINEFLPPINHSYLSRQTLFIWHSPFQFILNSLVGPSGNIELPEVMRNCAKGIISLNDMSASLSPTTWRQCGWVGDVL